jgi:hypothetical protein
LENKIEALDVLINNADIINSLKISNEPVIINVSIGLGSLTNHSSTLNPNSKIYDAYNSS